MGGATRLISFSAMRSCNRDGKYELLRLDVDVPLLLCCVKKVSLIITDSDIQGFVIMKLKICTNILYLPGSALISTR